MFKYEKAYRQGEILFFKVKSLKNINLSYGMKAVRIKSGVIKEGEKEGHEHKVEGNATLDLFATTSGAVDEKEVVKEADTGVLNVLKEAAKVIHPEHKDVKLPKGEYVVKVQKEAIGKNASQSVKD